MCQAQYENEFNVEGEMVFICHVCIDEKHDSDDSQEVGQEVTDSDAEVDLINGTDNEGY